VVAFLGGVLRPADTRVAADDLADRRALPFGLFLPSRSRFRLLTALAGAVRAPLRAILGGIIARRSP
jgi:hypothetical protein